MSFRQTCGNWRSHAWAWYLAATGALTAAYLFFPPLAGNGPLINSLGLLGVIGIVAGMGFNFLCTRYLIFRFKPANPEHFRGGA